MQFYLKTKEKNINFGAKETIFISMKCKLFFLTASILLVPMTLLSGCAGSSNGEDLEVPTNLPPICRDIDFVSQPDMREMCGVRKVHNRAYKNIPQQRYLIKPTETSIVKTNDKLELRFQNALPLTLDGPIVDEIQFNQDKRLEKIINTYDYHEIYSKAAADHNEVYSRGTRLRIFKMGIPTDKGNVYNFCFRVPERKGGNERTRSKAMGNHIEAMTCEDYDMLLQNHTANKN